MERGIGKLLDAFTHAVAYLPFLMIALAIGYAGTETFAKESADIARVHTIRTFEDGGAVKVLIEGDRPLEYTYIKQPFPLSVVLQIQGASIDGVDIDEVGENEIISSVSVSESSVDSVVSRVEILLKKDVSFDVNADGDKLFASFPAESGAGEKSSSGDSISLSDTGALDNPDSIAETDSDGEVSNISEETVEETAEIESAEQLQEFFAPEKVLGETSDSILEQSADKKSPDELEKNAKTVSAAEGGKNTLSSVSATPQGNSLVVAVGADETIGRFKTFTIKESDIGPARIVVDIFDLHSPFENEMKLPVNFDRVDRIRHRGYSDKVRLVIDTQDALLSAYTVQPSEDGLEIKVVPPADEKPELLLASTKMDSVLSPHEVFADNDQKSDVPEQKSETPGPLTEASEQTTGAAEPVSGTLEETSETSERKSETPGQISEGPEQTTGAVEPVSGGREQILVASAKMSEEPEPKSNPQEQTIDEPEKESEAPEQPSVFWKRPSGPSENSEPEGKLISEDKNAPADQKAAPKEAIWREDTENNVYSGPNYVKRIDFSGRPAGESTLLIGAARPIRYEIKELSNKKLLIRLFDTRIAEHQRRPLITTRFESAVDRILPIQTSHMKDAIVSVELREMTPFQVETVGNDLLVNFGASSIPPKPLEEAGLPSWRQAMEGPFPEADGVVSPGDFPDSRSLSLEGGFEASLAESREPGKKFTGEKIALDFFETDIKNVFRILREVSGKNFAIDRDVEGSVTVTLEKPVPWDQVLDLILKMNQLGKVEEGDIIRIAKMSTITKEEQDRQAKLAAEAQAMEQERAVEPLMTEYIPVNYSDARSEILPHLENIATTDRGKLSVDSRTNMVIMTDTAEKIRQAKEIVKRLDMVTPQVIIEARIVEASSTFSREIGIQWSVDGGTPNNSPGAGQPSNPSFSDTLGGTWAYDSAVNLPVPEVGTIGFQFQRIFGTPITIDAQLGAMESQGEGKVVSAPKVMTLDNKKATIKQGREVPYSVIGDDGMVNVAFKNVDLLLEVTPHVTPDSRIALRVFITKNEIAEFSVDGVPSLATREAETELLVNDGETIVIGGILQTTDQETTQGVPGLYKLPVLGWLFKWDKKESRKEELLIFLTPRIMQLEQKNI